MMGVMTAQPPLPLAPAGAILIGDAAAMLADDDGGRVFIRGELCFVWDADDEAGRRLAAVQLVRIKAASLVDVAAGFAVSTPHAVALVQGVGRIGRGRAGPGEAWAQGPLAVDRRPGRRHPCPPHRRGDVAGDRRRGRGLRQHGPPCTASTHIRTRAHTRDAGRAAGRLGGLAGATDTGGSLPSGLRPGGGNWWLRSRCSHRRRGYHLRGCCLPSPPWKPPGCCPVPQRFSGGCVTGSTDWTRCEVEGVLRALAGQPRAEGSTRVDPAALGRVLGSGRAPEVKTIRRKITALAATGRADELLAAMAARHVAC